MYEQYVCSVYCICIFVSIIQVFVCTSFDLFYVYMCILEVSCHYCLSPSPSLSPTIHPVFSLSPIHSHPLLFVWSICCRWDS